MRGDLGWLRTFASDLSWSGRWLFAPVRGLLVLTALFHLVFGVAPALIPMLTRHLVDHLVGHQARDVAWLVVGVACCLMLPAVLQPFGQVIEAVIEQRALRSVDELVIETGHRMPDLTLIDRARFHDRVETLGQAFTLARLPEVLIRLAGLMVGLITIAVTLGSLVWWLPVALLVAVLPYQQAVSRSELQLFGLQRDQSRARRELAYCFNVITQPQLAKEVRAFGLAGFFAGRYRQFFGRVLAESTATRLRTFVRGMVLCGPYVLALIGTFWYLAWRAGERTLTLGQLTLYLTGVTALTRLLMSVAPTVAVLLNDARQLRPFREIVDSARPGIALADPGCDVPPRLAQGLRLDGVRFRYPGTERDVLTGIDLDVPAGKTLALVGENGEGKSTMVKLLTRMYDADGGTITLDGRPLADYDLVQWRRAVATVFQDHARFAFTLADNILAGEPDLLATLPPDVREARLRRAAAKGGAETVAAKVGYDTELTRRFGGVDLSGGEWGRVATARAFLPDAALIILDEPTSALDVDGERHLFDAFARLVQGRTAIVISHRFSTVRRADAIAVIVEGRIAEYGTHTELMRLGGRYAEMFAMQADRYR